MNPLKQYIWRKFMKVTFYNLTIVKCRSITLCPVILSDKHHNPLSRKKFYRNQFKDQSKEVTRICMTILGNGATGQPRCLGLLTDHKAILFNCGEGVGRLLREYGANFHLIKYAFITQRDWANLSGLPDIHLTHDAYGIYRLNLFGPPGIEHFAKLISSNITSTKLVKRDTPYIDSTFEIKSICITPDNFKNRKKNQGSEDVVFAYSCKIFEKPAELVPEKLVEHNVPFGPHLLKLKNGEDVVLHSGKIIRSSDVLGSYQKEEILLVVDCPTERHLLPFVKNEDLCQYQQPLHSASKVSSVFHFSPSHIVHTDIYQNWINGFAPATQHFILNESCPSVSSEAVHQTQSIFHIIHPDIFKLLPKPKTETQVFNSSTTINNVPPMLQINYWPDKTLNWGNVVDYNPEKYINETKYLPTFNQEIQSLKSFIASTFSPKDTQEFPEVIFLGTSSSTSSAYRNVTAILLNISSSKSILLDCGEGAVMQMVRYFGCEKVNSELLKMSCIFISHLHTDHYLGLFHLVKARVEAFKNANRPYQPLALILPFMICNIFKRFCEIFEPLSSNVRIFTCKSLTAVKKTAGLSDDLQAFVGNIEIETVPVRHCLDAYGIVLKNGLDWKIVYSGDSAPCQNLIDAGENCTLLIHEASIEDGYVQEATMKKHSTPAQVIDISERMNAQHTIMTHFSKRYLAVPVLEDANKRPVGCAFDFMKVQLHQLPLVPLFLPVMKCLFQEQLDSHSERTSFVVNFENNFLKSYRSVTES